MIEGCIRDDYLVFFDPRREVAAATAEYGVSDALPGYAVVGLRGWEDLVLSREGGGIYTVPAVPIDPEWLEAYDLPNAEQLRADARFVGKIKWHIKPLVLGGSPTDNENVTWVSHAKHREFVRYWNSMYRKLKAPGA